MPKKQADEFLWIGPTTYPRENIYNGKLEKGKSYPTKIIPKAVLSEWVKTGFAKLGKQEEKDGNT